jgi:transcriptional regulator with GAF, ATPase, and Fis domain
VRFVAATNPEMGQLVEGNEFREDLYYRLNAFPVQLRRVRLSTGSAPPTKDERPQTQVEAERDHILKALNETNWVLPGPQGAARRLGINRSALQFRMKKLGIFRGGADENGSVTVSSNRQRAGDGRPAYDLLLVSPTHLPLPNPFSALHPRACK